MIHWMYFILIISLMYICIATIGRITGGESLSAVASVRQLFTPLLIFVMILANTLFAVGIYYGFIVSSNALPVSVVIGIVVTFIYSVLVMGVSVTAAKILGIAFVLVGIYLLR